MRRVVVDDPDVGVGLVDRIEFDLLDPRRRGEGEVDEGAVETGVVRLDAVRTLVNS